MDVTRRKVKELKAIKPEDPARALSLHSFLTDLARLRRITGERVSQPKKAKENQELNMADTPEYREKLRRDFIKTYEAFQPLA